MRHRQREQPPNADQGCDENDTLKKKVKAQLPGVETRPRAICNCLGHLVFYPFSNTGMPTDSAYHSFT
jgi:hypothetical protein